jgi:hypothetical protein
MLGCSELEAWPTSGFGTCLGGNGGVLSAACTRLGVDYTLHRVHPVWEGAGRMVACPYSVTLKGWGLPFSGPHRHPRLRLSSFGCLY